MSGAAYAVLLVNCHDVTGRILNRRDSRQTGMKSPLKCHYQPEKKGKGLLESLRGPIRNGFRAGVGGIH